MRILLNSDEISLWRLRMKQALELPGEPYIKLNLDRDDAERFLSNTDDYNAATLIWPGGGLK